jgi:anti-sigma B factor antagonist
MNIRKRTVDSVAVITLDGQLDSHSAPVVQDKVTRLLPTGGQVLLEFSKVVCVSGEGVRTLLVVYRHAQGLDCQVALVGVAPEMLNVLGATGFLDFFQVGETIPDALAAMQTRTAGDEEQADEQPALRA